MAGENMQDDFQMHSKVVDQVWKFLPGTKGKLSPRLDPIIVYGEDILNLFQKIINALFMVKMYDVIRPGTQNDQKAYEVISGSQYRLIVTESIKSV